MSKPISYLFQLTRFWVFISLILVGLFVPLSCTTNPSPTPQEILAAIPTNMGFSDRPSWLSWEVARQKQFFEQNHANIDLKWFETYPESVHAFNSGLLDANTQTLADTLRAIAAGEDWVIVLVTDANPTPIPEFAHLVVTRQQIEERPEAVQGLVNAWFDSLQYIREKPEKADRIMAKRSNLTLPNPPNLATGMIPFGIAENLNAFAPGNDLTHIRYAAEILSEVLLNNGSIQTKPDLRQLVDDRFVKAYATS